MASPRRVPLVFATSPANNGLGAIVERLPIYTYDPAH